MKKNFKKLISLFALLVLVGAGCGSAPIQPEPGQEEQIYKQPEQENTLTRAYEACTKAGYKIVVQYDAKSSNSKAFCVFDNTSQCDAIAFLNNACSKKDGAKVFEKQTLSEIQLIRSCGTNDPSVCGIDGNNYSNACVAAQKEVPVSHVGICKKEGTTLQKKSDKDIEDEKSDEPDDLSRYKAYNKEGSYRLYRYNNTRNGQATEDQVEDNTSEPANWINMIINLAKVQSPRTPRSEILKCPLGNQDFYLYNESGKQGFSVLYDDEGDTYCFPGNDLTDDCPQEFKQSSCSQIWKDAR